MKDNFAIQMLLSFAKWILKEGSDSPCRDYTQVHTWIRKQNGNNNAGDTAERCPKILPSKHSSPFPLDESCKLVMRAIVVDSDIRKLETNVVRNLGVDAVHGLF